MTAPTVIRASALSSYPDCNRRGAARLFWNELHEAGFKLRRLPRSIGAIVGVAIHRGAEIAFTEKAKTGSLPPVSLAADAAVDNLNAALGDGEIAYDGPRGPTNTRNDAQQQTARMMRAYHRSVAPAVNPILVEERLEVDAAPGLVLSGQPDIVCHEPGAVRDLKSGIRQRNSHAPQLGAYALLGRSHGFDITEAAIDFVQRVPLLKPQPEPVETAIKVHQAETAAANILKHIESDLHTFRHGDPVRRILPGDPWAFQANPASMLCSPKWCPAFGTKFCHEGDPAKEKH